MSERKIVHFVHPQKKRNTAGSKAPEDVTQICNNLGIQGIEMPLFPKDKSKLIQKIWLLTAAVYAWQKAYRSISKNSVIIYQHPSYAMRVSLRFLRMLQDKKRCRTIAIVHDLESLRGGIAGVTKTSNKTNAIGDNEFLKSFNVIICHNSHMREYMIQQGFNAEKLVDLEIFDYLTDAEELYLTKGEKPSLAIAGNLAAGKCSYIYDIIKDGNNAGLTMNLYGINFQSEYANDNMIYHGSFSPEELPGELKGDFGLVWDGNSADTCAGNTGEYLRFNNPHKTSLYLAAGMPVIVWKQAAIADFVIKNGVGIAVDGLSNIEETIGSVTADEYIEMCKKAREIGLHLRGGYYTKKAIETALKKIR